MDSSDYLSTPTGYATPQQLTAQRDYAKALMTGSGQQPQVRSWTQGVSNMVNALLGQSILAHTGNQDVNQVLGSKPSTVPGITTPVPGAAPNPLEGRTSDGQTNSDGDTDKAAKAIAGIESKGSGDYSAIGPVTHTGDRAYGKYQVMGANIPSWTREVLGKEMTPEEFLSNQAAQDKVFQTKFAQGGNNDSDRASVWFTGKPLAQGANRSDGNLTGAQYVQKFNTAMGAPSGGGAMAFAGPDGASQNPAVAAMGAALRNDPQIAENTQVAAAKGTARPGGIVSPNSQGQIYYNPSLIKPPPQISPEQMNNIMLNSQLTPEAKNGYLQQYQNQGNAIVEMPWPGGKIRIDARNPTNQQFIPDLQKNTTEYPGGYKPGGVYTVTPGTGGTLQTNPALEAPTAAGPRSEAQPSAAPTAGPQPTAPGAAAVAQSAPAAPVTAPATAPNAPVQVASLDPTAGFKAAAAGAAPTPGTQVAENAAPVSPPTNPMAQAIRTKPPGDIPQRDWNVITGFQDLNRQNEIDKEAGVKGVDAAMKKYDTLSTRAQAARAQMPNLDLALSMMNNPNFHSGLVANAQDVWSRFKAAALGDTYANAPNEAFDKIMAATVLGGIKDVGGGQIRNAEIQLLGKANANRNNTDASNRAVLEVSRRALQTTDHLDQIGQAYVSGDEVVDPVSGKVLLPANEKNGEVQPRRGLDVGYDKLAREFMLTHPAFTPDEIKHYETIFDTGRDPSQVAAETPATGNVMTKEFDDGKGGKVTGVSTDGGKTWGPKK